MDTDALAVDRLHIAWRVARRMCRQLGLPAREVEDVAAEARLILVQLAREYDPGRGVPFAAFAERWLPWRLIDALRTSKTLYRQKGPRPRIQRLDGEQVAGEKFGTPQRLTYLDDPAAGLEREDSWRLLERQTPSPRAAELVRHILRGKNQREAGEAMGVSESRASQLHSEAAEYLREVLVNRREEFMR